MSDEPLTGGKGGRNERPWHAIVLIGGILGTVVAVHAVALVAYRGSTGYIVREYYYVAGEAFDGELKLRAGAAGGGFEVRCRPAGSCKVIGRGSMAEKAGAGTLVLQRADDASRDVRLPMSAAGKGQWTAGTDALVAGWWRARVELGDPVSVAWKGRIRVEAAP